MNRLNMLGRPKLPEGNPAVHQLKYDRTTFDYLIIAAAYLFMPIGLILALIRLIGSHYKNYRKSSNYNLMFHVFIGGFVEMAILSIAMTMSGDLDNSDLIILMIVFILVFLSPAFIFAHAAAEARIKYSRINNAYMELILNKGIRHIGSLSDKTGQSEKDVRRDISYLKEKDLLPIDTVFYEERLISEEPESVPSVNPLERSSGSENSGRSQPSAQQLPKSIRCRGCGAQNTVQPNQSTHCEYCGTTITYS